MARIDADECFSHPRKSALSAVKNLLVKTRKETIAYKADKKVEAVSNRLHGSAPTDTQGHPRGSPND